MLKKKTLNSNFKNITLFNLSKTLVIILFLSFNAQAQNTFKKGYYTNNKGIKKEGFFMTFNGNIPETVIFKENKSSAGIKKVETKDISELKISNLKFSKKNVSLEVLEKKMFSKKVNNSKVFKLQNKTLLLKVLLSFDNFILYSYSGINNEYFFLGTEGEIELLKYKKIRSKKREIEVRDFVRQLIKKFNIIEPTNQKNVARLKYKSSSLVNFFTEFSKQKKYNYFEYSSYLNRDFKDAFNLTPKIGYSFNSQSINTSKGNFETSFKENHVNFGLDIEYFFNNIKKKSSLVFSYEYHSKIDNNGTFNFTVNNDSKTSNNLKINTINFKYRRYFEVFKDQYFFIEGGLLFHSTNGKAEYTYTPTNAKIADLEYNKKNNLAFSIGLGYNYHDLYLGLNYIPVMSGDFESFSTNATRDSWEYDRSLLNLTIGYSIF